MTEIVVGIDGTVASASALTWARMIADRLSARLVVVGVVDVDIASVMSAEYTEAHARAVESLLDDAKAATTGTVVETRRAFGRVVSELVAQAKDASVLVVGSDKTGVISGIIHGTIPLKVADSTESPLVVVPAAWKESLGPIVVGVDDTTDNAAITFAAEMARALTTDLLLVNVWGVAPLVFADPLQLKRLTAELRAAGRLVLDTVHAELANSHPSVVVTKQLVEGDPSVGVLTTVRATAGTRLVVVGTRRLSPLSSLLLGSVGHDLLMNMPCPVAIVPPTRKEL
ncbi:universal stress protein [Lacisediminihabitans changchengi]|uniref:Universal stress protein n=1 Tax=Lacisediminihabitans changchengi TaxID=2787634 RepID=A0A934VYD0_9MICO|nr:universal stress protein [Lacisediminihabitans changchengi]MBK4346965.1 universal stress protein [Lacisediminihabitans changchengi]MBK4347912.1 universal stress protein [Lacisediminihabitans changchengi]